jgi:hypothetical protein
MHECQWFKGARHDSQEICGDPSILARAGSTACRPRSSVGSRMHRLGFRWPCFWLLARVGRAMPDFAQREAWLVEHGMEFEGT